MPSYNSKLIPLAKNLRKNMTKEERHLWYDFLRNYPIRFRRQKVIGAYIVDFYCAEAKLIIELDGSQHFDPAHLQKDAERSAFLTNAGFTVIRFSNNDVTQNFRAVCEHIDHFIRNAIR